MWTSLIIADATYHCHSRWGENVEILTNWAVSLHDVRGHEQLQGGMIPGAGVRLALCQLELL